MIACHCEVVSERVIRATVMAGAACPAEVADLCGAGSACGGCHETIERLIAESVTPVRLAVA